ncbi:MAG: M36 family metallopeptidase [Myxococcales bacterium]|nr:M36 family metallopeptidase [Myxococcales bacterium]
MKLRVFSRRLMLAALAATAACADGAPAPTDVTPRTLATTPAVAGRLWVAAEPAQPAATAAASAIAHVRRIAPRWGAPAGAVDLVARATLPVPGGELVRLAQEVDGVPVDRADLKVLIGPGGTLLAASGVLVPADLARDRDGFQLDARAAVARAVAASTGVDVAAGLRAEAGATADLGWFSGGAGDVVVERARARHRWHRDRDALVPVWVVEAYVAASDSTDSRAERVVVAARDGRVLARHDLTVDAAFTYRVWAETGGDRRMLDGPIEDFSPTPSGTPGGARPAFIAPNLVTVDGLNHPAGGPADPWLASGATETVGNNVDAYTDINLPGGLSAGDFRATTTSASTFDRTYDTGAEALASTAQQSAAIAQLFYAINWLHDDWYDAGFTEAAGNGQADNYGRGGVAGDALLAEAQDSANDGARNNANMSTPEDGMAPRMQVYLWSGLDDRTLTIGARTPSTRAPTTYGPTQYDLVGTIVAGTDGAGAALDDGCEPLTNDVTGRVALLARGNCTGEVKAATAQAAGAIGLIIAHNVVGSPAPGLPNDANVTQPITIPVMSVSYDEGVAIRADLGAGPVTATFHRDLGPEVDGALDAALVAHEFGHYVHHRLSDCNTRMCGAQSEGWGDFIALLTLARDGDDLTGAYAISTYASNDDPYFGIRRAPYSTDGAKNAFTFQMVADDAALPTSHPLAFAGANSEVHNAGEIWAQVMWEGYVALQQARGARTFDEARRTMMRYVVAGLGLAPTDATFTETRNAILAAARAASPADAAVLTAAFARRGLGSCAVSPPRDSSDFIGALESFVTKGNAEPSGVTVAIDVKDCDHDGALDVGETATITVPVTNVGVELLSAVTVTATGSAGLTISTPTVDLGALAPDGSGTASFQVTVADAVGPVAATVDVTITAPGGCTETRQIVLPIRLVADDDPAAAASDTFDALVSPWTPTGSDARRAWGAVDGVGLDRFWHGEDLGFPSDTAIESPAMTAGAGPVTVAFDHAYQFEFSNDVYWDGGVVEITTDAGATWRDVADLTNIPYDGPLSVDAGNVLAGQMAFSDQNPAFPARDHVVLDFGTQLAGTTFRLRFRIGTDASASAPGWDIDNLVVTGITNTPFPVVVADADACTAPPDQTDDGGCCSTNGGAGAGSSLAGGLVVAALLRRRRRRAA